MKDTNQKDYLFSALIMIILFALIAFGFLAVLKNIDLAKAMIIITFLTNAGTLLLGYQWGSSKNKSTPTLKGDIEQSNIGTVINNENATGNNNGGNPDNTPIGFKHNV